MKREEAERERDRLAIERPDSTWILHDVGAGEWEVVRIGLKPPAAKGAHVESPPKGRDGRPIEPV